MTADPVYLDHHATTPIDPRVLDAMLPVLRSEFGNPSSRHHAWGRRAHALVEAARAEVASLIGSEPDEIVFTSGATEANNLALKGAAEIYRKNGGHIVTSAIEHKSVLAACAHLAQTGLKTTLVGVGRDGLVDPREVKRAIRPETMLVSVMTANNEIGTIQPVGEIGKIAAEAGILFHTDATQAAGKIPFDVRRAGVHLAAFSAHKMYGPKGIGALYVRKRRPHARIAPLIDGGGHEGGLRSGTLNVPAIVGFGTACVIARQGMREEAERLGRLRDRLEAGLLAGIEGAVTNGSRGQRLPHSLNMSFPYVESESLIKAVPWIAVTSASACASAGMEPSYVLKAIGLPEDLIHGAIRFGLGRFNTADEIEATIREFTAAVKSLRDLSPLYRMAKEGAIARTVFWNDPVGEKPGPAGGM